MDTNLLVYAHRKDSAWHERAAAAVARLATGASAWAIPWPCLHEFLAVATHPRIYVPPTPLGRALDQAEAWLEAPTLVTLSEGPRYIDALRPLLREGRVIGPRIHDARIAALCAHHGVDELWTAERDFGRFPALRTHNPLVA